MFCLKTYTYTIKRIWKCIFHKLVWLPWSTRGQVAGISLKSPSVKLSAQFVVPPSGDLTFERGSV